MFKNIMISGVITALAGCSNYGMQIHSMNNNNNDNITSTTEKDNEIDNSNLGNGDHVGLSENDENIADSQVGASNVDVAYPNDFVFAALDTITCHNYFEKVAKFWKIYAPDDKKSPYWIRLELYKLLSNHRALNEKYIIGNNYIYCEDNNLERNLLLDYYYQQKLGDIIHIDIYNLILSFFIKPDSRFFFLGKLPNRVAMWFDNDRAWFVKYVPELQPEINLIEFVSSLKKDDKQDETIYVYAKQLTKYMRKKLPNHRTNEYIIRMYYYKDHSKTIEQISYAESGNSFPRSIKYYPISESEDP